MSQLEATPVLIVAEAGVNHNGKLGQALALVDAAAAAGADVVKFQSFRAEALVAAEAPKAPYQKRSPNDGQTQRELLASLELDARDHRRIAEHCRHRGIEFMSSPFDEGSLRMLVEGCAIERIKLGSGELTHGPLLVGAARTGLPLLVSTGMSTLGEIKTALGLLAFAMLEPTASPTTRACAEAWSSGDGQRLLRDRVILLHCTSAYPAPIDQANLRAIGTMVQEFGLPVGYSDHTSGVAAAFAAVALGAVVVEKHLTLDRRADGPDHVASCEPDEFGALVRGIRAVELALGDGCKRVMDSERTLRDIARRSLVARVPIAEGASLSAANLIAKRPGGGLSPMHYWDMLDTVASRSFEVDEPIAVEAFKRQPKPIERRPMRRAS